jgi:hypothetical protein
MCRASPLSCQSWRLKLADRHAADRGDAVIALLPADRLMGVAQRRQRLGGEQVALALDLLQAQDVGRGFGKQLFDQADAQAGRIDVPGGDSEHASTKRFNSLTISSRVSFFRFPEFHRPKIKRGKAIRIFRIPTKDQYGFLNTLLA